MLSVVMILIGLSTQANSDYKCFIDPMDKYPENRVNVVPTLGWLALMHVSLSDRKTLLAEPIVLDIIKEKIIGNMEVNVVSTGTFSIDKFPNKYGKHNGLYVQNGMSKGYIYSCQKIRVVRD